MFNHPHIVPNSYVAIFSYWTQKEHFLNLHLWMNHWVWIELEDWISQIFALACILTNLLLPLVKVLCSPEKLCVLLQKFAFPFEFPWEILHSFAKPVAFSRKNIAFPTKLHVFFPQKYCICQNKPCIRSQKLWNKVFPHTSQILFQSAVKLGKKTQSFEIIHKAWKINQYK